jgi:hypothetical protein
VTCTIVYLDSTDLPTWQPIPSLYAVFKIDNTVFYARFFASSSSTESQIRATAKSPKKYIGLVLPFALCELEGSATKPYASVLVLEDKGKCFERLSTSILELFIRNTNTCLSTYRLTVKRSGLAMDYRTLLDSKTGGTSVRFVWDSEGN